MKNSHSKIKQPTMYDVAKLAGVSQPTVSRVLNQNDTSVQISDDTRQRVMDAVDKLGYRPNVTARSLRTHRSHMIALLIADISNGFYHSITRSIQDVARHKGYEVLISNSDHVYENEKHFCEVVSGRGVDGLIMVPIHLTNNDLSNFYTQTRTPMTVLGIQITHPNIDVVYLDDEKAVYETAKWMISERGYTSLGYVGVSDDLPPGPRRWRGFTRALGECGVSLDPRYVIEGDFTLESGRKVAHQFIEMGTLPRAIFALNDLMAIGLILALQDAGYKVPDDVAVVGFDDIPEATIVRPALTTIAQNPQDIGIRLCEALIERIEDPQVVERRVYESFYKLMQRQSG